MSTLRIRRVLGQFDPVSIIERGKTGAQAPEGSQKRDVGSSTVSAFTFYRRHRRRGITVVASMALAILIITLPTFAATATLDAVKPNLAHLQLVSQVLPYRSSAVDPGVMAQIRSNPAVDRVIPIRTSSIEMSIPLGDGEYVSVYGVQEDDLAYLVDLLSIDVVEGRLPRARSNEFAVTEAVAANHGFAVGDTVGIPYIISGLNQNESTDMVLVGILNSQAQQAETGLALSKDMWLGLASFEFMENNQESFLQSGSYFVAPVEGRKAELDDWLESSIASPQTAIVTYRTQLADLGEEMRFRSLIMTFIEIGIVVIAGIAMATMNHISFTQRHGEFGVLNALGRSRRWLVLRAIKEIGGIAGIAWLMGSGVYGLVLLLAQYVIFEPKGIALNVFAPLPWLFTLPIPLVIILTSGGAVAQVLRKFDPVAVVEGR